jgi:hypothetical protein
VLTLPEPGQPGGMIASKWPVLVSLAVLDGDRDDEGALTEAGVARLFAEARAAYFDSCTTIDGAEVVVQEQGAQPGLVVEGDEVTVSVSVVEVFPDSFTMHALVRPAAGGEESAAAKAKVAPASGEVTGAMRDEFIAKAHAARHYH